MPNTQHFPKQESIQLIKTACFTIPVTTAPLCTQHSMRLDQLLLTTATMCLHRHRHMQTRFSSNMSAAWASAAVASTHAPLFYNLLTPVPLTMWLPLSLCSFSTPCRPCTASPPPPQVRVMMVTAMSPCKTPRQVVKKKTKLPWPMLLQQLMARVTCLTPSWPKQGLSARSPRGLCTGNP